MNEKEYETLKSLRCDNEVITVSDVSEETAEGLIDRTLLYGYTPSRFTWHVYLKDERIHKLIYANREPVTHDRFESVEPKILIPNKRLYPEACDYSFCALLITMGFSLPFTTWNPDRKWKIFYGMVM